MPQVARNFLVDHIWVQRLLVVSLIVLTFWNGLWGGAPRADQYAYLHQIGQLHDLKAILLSAPSWNRTQAAGDFLLFRPLLFMQLGSFYYFFGYNFFLWQLGGLTFHIGVILGLHLFLLQGSLRFTLLPLLMSALFGVSFLGAELVLWNHLGGYILFCVFAVYSVLFAALFFRGRNVIHGCCALGLTTMAEFTYELGVVVAVLISIAFFFRALFLGRKRHLADRFLSGDVLWGILFFLAATAYPIASILDIRLRGLNIAFTDGQGHSLGDLLLTLQYTGDQIAFWMGGILLPMMYNVGLEGRAVFQGLKYDGTGVAINAALLLLMAIAGGKVLAGRGRSAKDGYGWLCLALGCLFVALYSWVIAYGRALPRGLEYVIKWNVYYSYVCYVAVIVAVGLYFVGKGQVEAANDGQAADRSSRLSDYVLEFSLLALIFCNAYQSYRFTANLRFVYSAPKQEVIDRVQAWLANEGRKEGTFFTIAETCPGNEVIPWFQGHFRRGSGWHTPVTMADVLWPEKSFQLNRDAIGGRAFNVTQITCGKSS